MAFYNRILAQAVQRYIDANGQSHPLDVLTEGGASLAQGQSVNPGSGGTALAAPPAGFMWRLHHVSTWNWPSVAAGAFPYIVFGENGTNCFGPSSYMPFLPLNGLLVPTALTYIQPLGGGAFTLGWAIAYDLVATPNIQ